MSTLLLIIKRNGQTTIISRHYRRIKQIIADLLCNKKIDDVEGTDMSSNVEIDSGLIIINFDSSKIFSCQNAFGLHNLEPETRKAIRERWEYIEYPGFVE